MIPTYASLLELCCTTKNLQKLCQLHSQTIKLGISYNDFIRAKLISSYVSCAQMADAHLIFTFTNRKSTFLYNTLIRGYASSKQFDLSLAFFQGMLLNRKPFDLNTLPAVLKSVAALSALRLGRQVHSFILVHGLDFDLAHNNSLITMYGKCGDLYSARNLFDRIPERNLITWCAMMGVYGMHGNFDEVLRSFDRMLNLGFLPDGKAYTMVLTACSHGGMIEKGKDYFDLMVNRYGLKPSLEHYTCMIDMLSRAGRVEEAKGFVDRMNMKPDEAVWRALLKSHRIQAEFMAT